MAVSPRVCTQIVPDSCSFSSSVKYYYWASSHDLIHTGKGKNEREGNRGAEGGRTGGDRDDMLYDWTE